MIAYIDTGFLLSIIFDEEKKDESLNILNQPLIRVSSILLEIEIDLNVRKFIKFNNINEEAGTEIIAKYKNLVDLINLKKLDSSIIRIIKNTAEFENSKSLDAVHLATAMEINRHNEEPISIFSYDKQMNQIAEKLGLEILKR